MFLFVDVQIDDKRMHSNVGLFAAISVHRSTDGTVVVIVPVLTSRQLLEQSDLRTPRSF